MKRWYLGAFVLAALSCVLLPWRGGEVEARRAKKPRWKPPAFSPIRLQRAGVLNVEKQPKQIAVSPDNTKAYVTNFGQKSVSVLDLKRFRVLKTIRTGGAPVEAAFTPDSRYVYITNFDGETKEDAQSGLWKIETATQRIAAHIPLHRYPKGVVVSPDGKKVYFSSWWWPEGYLAEVSVKTNKILRRRRLWNRPRGMAMSPDGKYLYICQFGNDKSKIKGDTSHHQGAGLAILTTHDLKLVKLPYLGYMTRHVSISPDGQIAYTSQLGDSEIVATNAKTGEILRRLKSAWGPKTNDLTRDGRFLFVANYFGRSLSVIDTKSFQEIARLPFPDRLSGLDVDPEDRYVYVTGWDTGRVWRVRILRQETPNKP